MNSDEDDLGQLFREIVALSWDEQSEDEVSEIFYLETQSGPVYYVPANQVYGFPVNFVYGFPISDFNQDGVNDTVIGYPIYPYVRLGTSDEEQFGRRLAPTEIIEDYYQVPAARDNVNGEQTSSHSEMFHRNPNQHFPFINGTKVKTIMCVTKVLAVWMIVFTSLLNGPDHESGIIQMGMGSSMLLEPNRFYIDSITVKQVSKNGPGPILYGFKSQPSLNVISNWSVKQYAYLQAHTHKEWRYFLNVGSKINVSYNIPSSSKLVFMIDKARTGYNYGESQYDRSSPNVTLYWSIIQGKGLIQQNIPRSGQYMIAFENLNTEAEEVQFNISAKSLLYNTSEATYMCRLGQSICVFPLFLFEKRFAVLTTPLKQGSGYGQWYIALTYGPRWTVFFGVIVVSIGMMLVVINLWKNYRRMAEQDEHLD